MIGRQRSGRGGLAWTVIWVAGSRLTMLGCSFLGSIVMFRYLGATSPGMAQAGLFAISMAIIRVLTGSIGSSADLTVLRSVPGLYQTDRPAANEVVRAAFLLRAGATVVVLLAGFLGRSWIADRLLNGSEQATLVVLIGAAGAAELLLRAVLAFFQAIERFDRFVAFEALFQAGRLVAVLLLAWTGLLTVTTALVSYAVLGLLAAGLGACLLPGDLFGTRAVKLPALIGASRFFAWTMLWTLLSAAKERMDLFLIGRFRGALEAGLYGGMLTLALIPDFFLGLLATVLQPRIVRLHARGEFRAFNRRLLMVMVPPGLLAIAVTVMFGHSIVVLALGPRYEPDADAFVWLAVGAIAWLVLTAAPAILISLRSPRATTALTIFQLAMVTIGGLVVIPRYGPIGAAVVVACARVVTAVLIIVLAQRMLSHPAAAAAAATG